MHKAQGPQEMHRLHLSRAVLLGFGHGKVQGGVSFFSRTHRILHPVRYGVAAENGRVDARFEGFRIDASGGQNGGRSAVRVTQDSEHQMVCSDLRAAGAHRLFAGKGKNVAKILGKLHNY